MYTVFLVNKQVLICMFRHHTILYNQMNVLNTYCPQFTCQSFIFDKSKHQRPYTWVQSAGWVYVYIYSLFHNSLFRTSNPPRCPLNVLILIYTFLNTERRPTTWDNYFTVKGITKWMAIYKTGLVVFSIESLTKQSRLCSIGQCSEHRVWTSILND